MNVVTCGRSEAEILLTAPGGEGRHLRRLHRDRAARLSRAAAHGKRVQAQTEAKNHGIVLRDASLERAARGIINSTFGCAGMRCMALPVICVENAVADEFIDYLVQFRQGAGDGLRLRPQDRAGAGGLGRAQAVRDRLDREGVSEGAELLLDGRDVVVPGYEGGFFVGPDDLRPGEPRR